MVEPIALYIHLPFCRKKCPYCHFFVTKDTDENQALLLEGLTLEIERHRALLKRPLSSIYFGGGTPSLCRFIPQLLERLSPPSDAEITLEANPDDITYEKMRSFAACGINRVSIGVQSLQDAELHTLGRAHSSQRAIDALYDVERAGIDNASIDLMYEIPDQTLDSFRNTLERLRDLPFTHLSLYNLTFEEGTPFFRKKEALFPRLPREESALQMLHAACSMLQELGLERYEISAFAKPGRQSQHNRRYWLGSDFLGFGPSAFGYIAGTRMQNIPHIGSYVAALQENRSPVHFSETLSPEAQRAERLAIGLRLFEGVPKEAVSSRDLQKSVERLIDRSLLTAQGDRFALTELGRLFYDDVGAELIRENEGAAR